jgi:hypothetical protein
VDDWRRLVARTLDPVSADLPFGVDSRAGVAFCSGAPSSRSVLYELLYGALIEIRAASGGLDPMTDDDRDSIFFMSNLVHNWPGRLCAATTDEDHDELLASEGEGEATQTRGCARGSPCWVSIQRR